MTKITNFRWVWALTAMLLPVFPLPIASAQNLPPTLPKVQTISNAQVNRPATGPLSRMAPNLQSAAASQALPVPFELSGIKTGNSETAVDVSSPSMGNSAASGSASPQAPMMLSAAANRGAALPAPQNGSKPISNSAPAVPGPSGGSLQQLGIVGASDPRSIPATLASSEVSEQDGATGQISIGSFNFGSSDGTLKKVPSVETLTAVPKSSSKDSSNTTTSPAKFSDGVARSSNSTGDQTTISMSGPSLRVETVGPRSISLNKTAAYEIRVTNAGSSEARGVNVAANFPAYIELMSARPSTGTHDHNPADEEARLKWRIESLPAGKAETVIVNLTPRQAQLFDLQISWATDPVRGFASVEVTEPKLEMKIAGPADVMYGEKAIYTVTIRNPGTGIAENVDIMLSEQLGGQRATVGNIMPNSERSFEVELVPGEAGNLLLEAFAKADNLEHSVAKEIMVRRANLEVITTGPPALYAGTTCTYSLTIRNTGDSIARDVIAATVLPAGATYVSGIEGAEQVESGLRWNLGSVEAGTERSYQIVCTLNQPGNLRLEAGVRGSGDLAATNVVNTRVEALADLVLSVEDPKGPLPINQDMSYTVRVKNRGSKAALNVQLAMQFSEGIEPIAATGSEFQIEPGQISFKEISQIEIDQEIVIKVTAKASQAGNMRFRAVLNSSDPKTEELAQGTTKFFGSEIGTNMASPTPNSGQSQTVNDSLRR